MTVARVFAWALLLVCGLAHAQSGFVSPDGKARYPGVTVFCPNGTGVAPCNFGGGGGGQGGAVSINLGGSPVSGTNRFPVADSALDALISGGALTVGFASTPSISVANFPVAQPVTQSGTWSVGVSALPALPAGGNAIGSVSVTNFPGTQPVSAAVLPLPSGAATATNQTAPLAPVAPGAASATASVLVGCLANTTLPGFTAGQQGAIPCDGSGRPYVVTVPSANNVPAYLQAVATGGSTPYRALNAANSTMAANVKSSTGMIYGYEACNAGTATVFLRLFALGTTPVPGTSTPTVSKLIAAGACQGINLEPGVVFSNGIGLDVTSGSMADSDATAVATANTVSVELYYK